VLSIRDVPEVCTTGPRRTPSGKGRCRRTQSTRRRLILIDPIAVPDDVRALFGSREVVTVLTPRGTSATAAALGFPRVGPGA